MIKRFLTEIFQDFYDAFSAKRLIGIVGFLVLLGMFAGAFIGVTFSDALVQEFGTIVTTALIAIAGEQFNWTRWKHKAEDLAVNNPRHEEPKPKEEKVSQDKKTEH